MNEKLNLIERIQKMMKPTEVTSTEYFRQHLVNDDPSDLKRFIVELAKEIETPISVIAIGDSVYPDNYFENHKRYKSANDPSEGLKAGYMNISLIVAPQVITHIKNLRTEISAALRNLEYRFDFEEFPIKGEYAKKEVIVNTELKNGTPIELLLGREDIITTTAKHVIDYNRKNRIGFSVLYSDRK